MFGFLTWIIMVELSSLMIAWDGREVFGVWASMAGACGALDK